MTYECEAIRLPRDVSARVAFGYLTVDGDPVDTARMLRRLADALDPPTCTICGGPLCRDCHETGAVAGSTTETEGAK